MPCVCQGAVDSPREEPLVAVGWLGQITLKHVHFQGVLGKIWGRKVAERPEVLCGLEKLGMGGFLAEVGGIWTERYGVAKISKVCQSCVSGWKGTQDAEEGKLGKEAKLPEKNCAREWALVGPGGLPRSV